MRKDPLAQQHKKLRVLDLFAGAGGMSLGFHDAGFHTAVAIDHNPIAAETLEANFGYLGTKVLLRDLARYTPKEFLRDLVQMDEPTDFDVVVGGPPCQGWSKIGRAKLRSLKGSNDLNPSDFDPRNNLYLNFLEFIRKFRPKVALMENVPGMLSYQGRNMADEVAEDMANCGYEVKYSVFNASHYGVPQNRERLIFVGVRSDLKIGFDFPKITNIEGSPLHPVVTVKDAIGDLPAILNGARNWVIKYKPAKEVSDYARFMRRHADSESLFDHVCRDQNEQDVQAFKLMRQGGKYADLPQEFKRYRDDIFDDKYRRLIANKPSWCITAHLSKDCYSHIHPTQARTISVREAARIQSFPDSFYFGGNMGDKFQLIGNAVPPVLAMHLAQEVKKQILKVRPKSQTKTRSQSKEVEIRL